MPVAITGFFAAIGTLLTVPLGLTLGPVAALAVGVTTVLAAGYALRRTASALNPEEVPRPVSLGLAIRSTEAPRNIVYGESLVGGVITYCNVDGPTTEFRSLYFEVIHTGHEVDSFIGWKIDQRVVFADDVDTGGDGSVDDDTNSHGLGPIGGTAVAYLRGATGTSSQTVDSMLDSAFADITSDHRHRGCARTVARFDLLSGGEQVYEGRAPSPPSPIIRGKKVYDPRQDGTLGYSPDGGHRVATSSTWEWSDNPALCLADYLMDSTYGPGVSSSRIDWASVATAADICDTLVVIPPSSSPPTQEKRFVCNLTVDTSMEHATIIQQICDTMAGRLQYFNGEYRVYAAAFEASSFTLDDSDLTGEYAWQKQPSTTRGDRYNQVKGVYRDPNRNWQASPFLTVDDTTLRADRDNDRVLPTEIQLDGVTGEYQAQRLAYLALAQASSTGILEFPMGYQGANIRVGDTGTVTLSELNFVAKEFRCISVRYVDFEGVVLLLKEDTDANYDDPVLGDYGVRSAAGGISFPRARHNITNVGDSVLGDPFFNRTTFLPDQTDADWLDGYWFNAPTSPQADISIERTGGALGGICVIDMDNGEGAFLFSRPMAAAGCVDDEPFRASIRLRKTTSATVTTGSISIYTVGWDSPPVYASVAVNAVVDLLLDQTDINGWTVNEWQTYTATGTVIGTADFLATVGVRLHAVLTSGTELRLEVDTINLTRIS